MAHSVDKCRLGMAMLLLCLITALAGADASVAVSHGPGIYTVADVVRLAAHAKARAAPLPPGGVMHAAPAAAPVVPAPVNPLATPGAAAIASTFAKMDVNGNGVIDVNEFVAAEANGVLPLAGPAPAPAPTAPVIFPTIPPAAVAPAPAPAAEAEEEAAAPKKKKKKAATDSPAAAPAAEPEKKKGFKDHSSHPFYKENNVTVSDVPAPVPATTFADSMLGDTITKHLIKKFKGGVPSPIQSVAWPLLMQGHDVFGIAKTGSGKTLAFILPFLARAESGPVVTTKKNQPRLLCLAPTKELVQQIAAVAEEFSEIFGADKYPVQCIIGGMPKYEQKESIKRKGCVICCASPGRMLDLVENDMALDLAKIQCLVLDEGDRMLDDGFIMTMRKLAEFCLDPKRQTVLFSATWPLEVSQLATGLICHESSMHPATITVMRKGESAVNADGNINTEDKLQLNDSIKQEVHVLKDWKQKWTLLAKEFDKHKGQKIIVFGLVKKEVARLEERMNSSGYTCHAIQGDMTQPARNAALEAFKTDKVRILVATDVAARGLDIPDVDVVINYTFPLTVEDWVHRTGRTGRAGKKGLAVTFFNEAGEFNEVNHCFDIIRMLESVKQPVPPELKALDSKTFTATKKKGHALYGNFFKSAEEMAKLEKKKVHVTFDNSDSE